MSEGQPFLVIRERFESSSQKNQNDTRIHTQPNVFPSRIKNKSAEKINGFPVAIKDSRQTVSNQPFPQTLQQREIIKEKFECGGVDNIRLFSQSIQQLTIVDPQTKSPARELKSFTELIQDKASTLRRKPAVPQKPNSKHVGFTNASNSNQLPINISPSLQYRDPIISKDRPAVKKRPVLEKSHQQLFLSEKQISSSVINLRQQFEQKFSQQDLNSKPERFENKNHFLPSTSGKTNVAIDLFQEGRHEVRRDENSLKGSFNKQLSEFISNEQRILEKHHYENRSPQMFNSDIRKIPPKFKDFSYNLEHSTTKVEASNLHVVASFIDEDQFSDDEFEDEETDGEPIYANFAVHSPSGNNDLPKLPEQIPRQRTSYAEPRSRQSELKPCMSFNQSDVKKNYDDKNEAKKQLQHITEELIKTENDYVLNLLKGITNYESMFKRKDLPRGLKGKEFDLFGNIKQIYIFHRDTLLPMLIKNQHSLNKLLDEFLSFLDNHRLYEYVLYTMNKRRSLEICVNFAPYFTFLQEELGEQLGIDDFLLQPIQRLPRYKMLFQNLLSPLFKARDKVAIASCCRVEKKIGALLDTVNEADLICDLVIHCDLNIFRFENKFRKALDLFVYDADRCICYGTKVFIFDKCMIYTEVRGKDLIFRGSYEADKEINLTLQKDSFTLSYWNPKMQECIFHGEQHQIQCCLEFVEEIFQRNGRKDFKEIDDKLRRKPLYRQSTDSGVGNMWTLTEDNESE